MKTLKTKLRCYRNERNKTEKLQNKSKRKTQFKFCKTMEVSFLMRSSKIWILTEKGKKNVEAAQRYVS